MWCKALASTIDCTVVGIMTMLTAMTMEGERGDDGHHIGEPLPLPLPTPPTRQGRS
jgi:hypothetical protein